MGMIVLPLFGISFSKTSRFLSFSIRVVLCAKCVHLLLDRESSRFSSEVDTILVLVVPADGYLGQWKMSNTHWS